MNLYGELDTVRNYGNHYTFVPIMINALGVRRVAEVGVLRGQLSARILGACPSVEEYFMIDPWRKPPEPHNYRGQWAQKSQRYWNALYAEAKLSVEPFSSVAKVVRMTSESASRKFDDGYLDLVYIDAIHTYDEVMNDIKCWTPKVSDDGFIAGDDYGSHAFKDVRNAVDEFFGPEIVVHGSPPHKWGYTFLVSKASWLRNLEQTGA